MNEFFALYAIPILQIIWIDILLSGDNAVIIALACRELPERQRKWGIALGAGAAVALRILFMLIVVQLLALPYLKLAGGLLLLIIAVKLIVDDSEIENVRAKTTLWGVVTTIALADAAMSLDNVLAIAAAARDHSGLIVFGVLLSIPLVVFGANVVLKALDRWPILVWAGAALLGWVAGDMISTDVQADVWLAHIPDIAIKIACMAAVIAVAFIIDRRRLKQAME